MSRRPAVTILAIDPDDDARWLEVRGAVVGETEEGANEHIDELARRCPTRSDRSLFTGK